MSESGKERGPSLLAWWEDEYGRPWQFIRKRDWYALRYCVDGEWRYQGDWLSSSDNHGATNCVVDTVSDRSRGER